MEQGLIDVFNDCMADAARDAQYRFETFSLGAQDVNLADYLLSNSTSYALVEFKFASGDLKSEARKPKRLKLCEALETQPEWRKPHDRCHFIAWADKSGAFRMNIYRHQICNKEVFGAQIQVAADRPNAAEVVGLDTFSSSFFSPMTTRGLPKDAFAKYIQWLYAAQDTRASQFEVVVRNPDKMKVGIISLTGLEALHAYMNPPPSAPGASSSRRFKRG